MNHEHRLNVLLFEDTKLKKTKQKKQTNSTEAHSDISVALRLSPMQVHVIAFNSTSFLKSLEMQHPDVIVLNIEYPTQNILNSLQYLVQIQALPIVVITRGSDAIATDIMMQCGVSSFIVGEFNAERIESVIEVAQARFKNQQLIRTKLREAEQSFSNHKQVTKAKTWLMEQHQLTEQEAHKHMRKIAMDTGQKMERVAKGVLEFVAQADPD